MTEQQFQSEMRRTQTMGRLATNPTDSDYYAGYTRGLQRAFHGEQFGNQQEHDLWLGLATDADESRATRGRGYRDGLAFGQ